jgi:hypothetical protein
MLPNTKIFDDRKFKGLFSIYSHFFNMLDNNSPNRSGLIAELKTAISSCAVEELSLTNVDLSYVTLLSKDLGDTDSIGELVQLFAMMKWLYRNNRKILEDSKLYHNMSRSTRSSVVMESEDYTHQKLRLALKSIDSEPKLLQDIFDKAMLLPTYKEVIVSLWTIVRNMKSAEQTRTITRVLKSEEFCCVIQALFDKFCDVDIFNNFSISIDHEAVQSALARLIIEMIEDHSDYVKDLIVDIQVSTICSLEELESVNKDLKIKYKDLKSLRYQEESKVRKEVEDSLPSEIEQAINEKVYRIDFGLSLQQKKDLLSTSKFLLLKSDDIKIVPVMDNVRMESVDTVANETLKGDYDAVVIITKNIWHKHSERVKALIGSTPLIYTHHTNRRLIIEDIYNQF